MNPYSHTIDPSLLGTFLAVADIGKIANASKILNLSQPAVTAQIRKLEGELKIQLFIRSVQGVTLTNEGFHFYEYAKKISQLINEASNLNTLSQEPTGILKIAASTTIGNHLLPEILCDYAKRYKNISLSLEVMSTQDVIDKIYSGETPLGLVEGLSRAANVKLEKLIDDELFAVIHPDIKSRVNGLKELKNFPMICRERGSGTREVVDKFLREHFSRKEISFQYELGSTEAIKKAVTQKLGIGFLSRWSIQHELNSGQMAIVSLGKYQIKRSFSWVFPSGGLRPTQQSFVDFMKKHLSINV